MYVVKKQGTIYFDEDKAGPNYSTSYTSTDDSGNVTEYSLSFNVSGTTYEALTSTGGSISNVSFKKKHTTTYGVSETLEVQVGSPLSKWSSYDFENGFVSAGYEKKGTEVTATINYTYDDP